MTPTTVPKIFSANANARPLDWTTRAFCGLASVACLAVLITAAWLTPDASGVGTHRQLGLAPCGLLATYGVPCPACGMTTSFTYLVHGHPADSLIAQPAGTVLCVLTAMAFWACGYVAITGRPGEALLARVRWTGPLVALFCVVIVGWAYKVIVVVSAARHG